MLFRLFFGTRFRSRLFESLKYGVHFFKEFGFRRYAIQVSGFSFCLIRPAGEFPEFTLPVYTTDTPAFLPFVFLPLILTEAQCTAVNMLLCFRCHWPHLLSFLFAFRLIQHSARVVHLILFRSSIHQIVLALLHFSKSLTACSAYFCLLSFVGSFSFVMCFCF